MKKGKTKWGMFPQILFSCTVSLLAMFSDTQNIFARFNFILCKYEPSLQEFTGVV